MTAALSPDCAVGKHPACNEDAWDFDRDAIAVCPCDCHGWVCPNCGDRMPPGRGEDEHLNCNWPDELAPEGTP